MTYLYKNSPLLDSDDTDDLDGDGDVDEESLDGVDPVEGDDDNLEDEEF